TNAYRASDRTSQYLLRNVIYAPGFSAEDTIFRTLVFKIFNKSETWELLEENLGEISLTNFKVAHYDRLLNSALASGSSLYSAGYIMPSGSGQFRRPRKHQMHLMLLEKMRRDSLFSRLLAPLSLKAIYEQLCAYPTIGPFLGFQFAIDLNYSDH